MSNVCKHGQLARVCNICELERERDEALRDRVMTDNLNGCTLSVRESRALLDDTGRGLEYLGRSPGGKHLKSAYRKLRKGAAKELPDEDREGLQQERYDFLLEVGPMNDEIAIQEVEVG